MEYCTDGLSRLTVQQLLGRWSFRSSSDRSSCTRYSTVTCHVNVLPFQSSLRPTGQRGLQIWTRFGRSADLMSWIVEVWFQVKSPRTPPVSRTLTTRISGPLMSWWEGLLARGARRLHHMIFEMKMSLMHVESLVKDCEPVLYRVKRLMFWMKRWITSELEIMVTVSQGSSGRSVVIRHLKIRCLLEHSNSVGSCYNVSHNIRKSMEVRHTWSLKLVAIRSKCPISHWWKVWSVAFDIIKLMSYVN